MIEQFLNLKELNNMNLEARTKAIAEICEKTRKILGVEVLPKEEMEKLESIRFKDGYVCKQIGNLYAFELKKDEIEKVTTKSVKEYVTTTDKISNLTFEKEQRLLNAESTVKVNVGKSKSKKELCSMVDLNYENENVVINDNKGLEIFDRLVHNAVVSLYLAGNKEFTHQMVYRAMTGNEKAKLNPKMYQEINNSLYRLQFSRIVIKPNENMQTAYKQTKCKYEGLVLHYDKVTAIMNGQKLEVYKLLRKPILLEYASALNQIGRADIKILDTPINKNKETLILQDYLQRRVQTIKGGSGNISNNILYSSIYDQLEIEENRSNGAIKKKKTKVRTIISTILDDWIEKKFIKGYEVNKKGKEFYSITIK